MREDCRCLRCLQTFEAFASLVVSGAGFQVGCGRHSAELTSWRMKLIPKEKTKTENMLQAVSPGIPSKWSAYSQGHPNLWLLEVRKQPAWGGDGRPLSAFTSGRLWLVPCHSHRVGLLAALQLLSLSPRTPTLCKPSWVEQAPPCGPTPPSGPTCLTLATPLCISPCLLWCLTTCPLLGAGSFHPSSEHCMGQYLKLHPLYPSQWKWHRSAYHVFYWMHPPCGDPWAGSGAGCLGSNANLPAC